jgi:dihydrofolate reductase
MRKVIYAMNVSLDGFIEDAKGNIDWTNPNEELFRHFIDFEAMIGVHFYGRRLYENMAAFWPTAADNPHASKAEIEYSRIWKAIKTVVFSKTLQQVGGNAELARGNIAELVNGLKAQPGKDMNVGGAGIAGVFMQLGLVDEFRLYVHPVVLGAGKPMFPQLKEKINLKLLETHTFGSGVVLLKYERGFER